jgi:hypothetical protein
MEESPFKSMRKSAIKVSKLLAQQNIADPDPENEDEIDKENAAKKLLEDIEKNKESLKKRHDIAIVLNTK